MDSTESGKKDDMESTIIMGPVIFVHYREVTNYREVTT